MSLSLMERNGLEAWMQISWCVKMISEKVIAIHISYQLDAFHAILAVDVSFVILSWIIILQHFDERICAYVVQYKFDVQCKISVYFYCISHWCSRRFVTIGIFISQIENIYVINGILYVTIILLCTDQKNHECTTLNITYTKRSIEYWLVV